MKIPLDTNVILRLEDTADAHHKQARSAVDWIDANGHEAVIVPRIMGTQHVADLGGIGELVFQYSGSKMPKSSYHQMVMTRHRED